MFMKYHWYAKFSIKKRQTVDIHLIKAETVIFNGINYKINQIFWNLLLGLCSKLRSHLGQGC